MVLENHCETSYRLHKSFLENRSYSMVLLCNGKSRPKNIKTDTTFLLIPRNLFCKTVVIGFSEVNLLYYIILYYIILYYIILYYIILYYIILYYIILYYIILYYIILYYIILYYIILYYIILYYIILYYIVLYYLAVFNAIPA